MTQQSLNGNASILVTNANVSDFKLHCKAVTKLV